MKKALLLAGLGTALLLGGCADKKTVEPIAASKPPVTESTTPSGNYLGASNPGGASTPSGGTGLGSPVMGSIPDSTPTDMAPRSGSGTSGSRRSASGATRVTEGTGASASGKATTAKTTASAHSVKYVVKKGETLSAIAKKHYGKVGSTTIKKIVAANPGMNPDKIRVGQTIVLP